MHAASGGPREGRRPAATPGRLGERPAHGRPLRRGDAHPAGRSCTAGGTSTTATGTPPASMPGRGPAAARCPAAAPSGPAGRGGHRRTAGRHDPHDEQRTAEAVRPRLKELGHFLMAEVAVDRRLVGQPEPVPPRRQPDGRRHRHLLPVARPRLQHGRMAPRRPATPHQGGHQQPAVVEPQDRRPPPGLLSMRGQSSSSERVMASSSRWRATRRGFWGVNHRCRGQLSR